MGDEFVTAGELQQRYRISSVTLWRWLNDAELDFPSPMIVKRQRLFRRVDIFAWESQRNVAAA
jgi:predicted DNA-binding transcriptional regulator AlpA